MHIFHDLQQLDAVLLVVALGVRLELGLAVKAQ